VQTSFAFEAGHAQQLALSFVSPGKAQSQNKAKNRTPLTSVPKHEEKAQSQNEGKSIATGKDGLNHYALSVHSGLVFVRSLLAEDISHIP
jgi:hypothetical protein